MGSVAIQTTTTVPSCDRVEPGSFPLKIAAYPAAATLMPSDAGSVAASWIETFNKTIRSPDIKGIRDLFLNESYWRDQLCLSWDFHCLNGPQKVTAQLQLSQNGPRIKSLALDTSSTLRSPTVTVFDADGKIHTVQAFLIVQTDVGSGAGIVRLVQDDGKWKVFTLFTCLMELMGYEEVTGERRPFGVEHGERASRENWLDQRNAEKNFEDNQEPTVLILGAGQAGLTVAARLKMLGVKSLVVDRQDRVGDNWRTRYHHLVLHDPVWYDHLPYLPFPEQWPVFTPKDKLGDWFESYAKLLELNVWTRTKITNSSWNAVAGKWTVCLARVHTGETETRVFHPKHIIQATGHSGEPNFPSDLKGLDSFTGSRLVHSSKFTGAVSSHGHNKRAIVVGCCNSGHDIAQDFYENGYSVTMIQRSSTLVLSAVTNIHHMSPLYGENGPATQDADMISQSVPNAVVKRSNIDITKVQNKADEKILQGLQATGFRVDKGPDESGLWIKYLQRGGGYYVDVGCSQLIIDGKIKIKQGVEINEVVPTGLKFADGEILEADEIVFATGYLNMRTQCRNIFGDEVADRVKDVWGFDEEGELRTIWRKTGHPGFWFMGGNLALCRWYSKLLALQIKALEEGVCKYEDL